MRNFCVLIIIILLFSCREDDSLDKALSQAGKNKVEFFQVLKYYGSNPKDSLKLKAAKFLISNMLQHYTAINQPIKEMQKKIKNSALIIYPNATHYSYLEYPILTYNIIEKFLLEKDK